MHQTRTPYLLSFVILLAGACRGGKPEAPRDPVAQGPSTQPSATASQPAATTASQPARADFLSIARPDAGYQARWTDVAMSQHDTFRTDISAKATAEGEVREMDLTLIQLRGPGEYPLGFGWNRGESRATIEAKGMRCMTPREGGGVVEITAGPADGVLAPGARLEGRFRVHCFPEGDETSLKEAVVFTGEFLVTVGEHH
jgi:hypothetical protein